MSSRPFDPLSSARNRNLVLTGLLLASCVLLMGFKQHTDEEIIRNFETVVFKSEHRATESKRVRKWTAPVKIYLDVRVASQKLIRKVNQITADELASVSGHDIRIVDRLQQANVISTFARMDDLLDAARAHFPGDSWILRIINTNLCTGRFFTDQRGAIYKAYIYIPTDRTFRAACCRPV